jgi:hypothetical protein
MILWQEFLNLGLGEFLAVCLGVSCAGLLLLTVLGALCTIFIDLVLDSITGNAKKSKQLEEAEIKLIDASEKLSAVVAKKVGTSKKRRNK